VVKGSQIYTTTSLKTVCFYFYMFANSYVFIKLLNMPTTIKTVEIFKLNIPMEPFTISLGTINFAQNILIKITLKNGIVAWGEGSPFPMLVGETQNSCFEIAKDLATLWLGKTVTNIEARINEINSYLAFNPTVKSAFDMALYDACGKLYSIPVYQLLGGGSRVVVTDETIGLSTAAIMAEKALAIEKKNPPAIKIKLGTNVADDINRIKTIRTAIGDGIPLRVDANQAWDEITAIQVLKGIAPFNVEYCEEPVRRWNNLGLKRVREHSPIPIMADESVFDHHDALKICALQAADFINIKLAKSGGLHNAAKVNAVAEAAGIKCMMGSMCESRLGLTASAHFASAKTNIMCADLDMVFTMKADPIIGGLVYKGYEIHLPDAPGLGCTVNEDYLATMESVVIE
jgi:L-Ala-D/L-Glu epimerase